MLDITTDINQFLNYFSSKMNYQFIAKKFFKGFYENYLHTLAFNYINN